ncbi:MAG TPA: galactokinase [Kiritimatiellia bacterium]|nr:galactokinase [Kiritimatiellia bacterium]HPS07249.1 galactokinase [Kiritimatiellia bacterium]
MVNESVYSELIKKYRSHFGREPEVVSYAPGRIEVLGNHTDYNEGFVFSAAINFGTFFAASKSASTACRLVAGDLMKEVTFDVTAVESSKSDTWQNYVKGTLVGLTALKPIAGGFDGMFFGNIPLGSGLSSSAALEMCTGLALGKLYGIQADKVTLARIGQKAEHTYAGCKCGLLDQISSLAGEEGKLVKTDFRTVAYETVAVGMDACFLMCNTHAKHALVDGAYNDRREACEQAAAHFANTLRHPVHALRDVSMAEWAIYKRGLPETVANRAAHPIGEDERVLKGAELLAKGDLPGFGALMFDSHESSRHLFENSCEELDAVVDAAKKIPGVLGARLSGGGFGGSVVVLVHPRDAETASIALANAYAAKFGKPCDVSVIKPAAGAHILK